MAELSANATKVMDLVKDLTIVELNDLVKAMEEEFGVSAAAPVMMAGWAAGGEEEEAKSTFDVELTSAGSQKNRSYQSSKRNYRTRSWWSEKTCWWRLSYQRRCI